MNRCAMLLKIEHTYQKRRNLLFVLLVFYIVLTIIGVTLSYGFDGAITYRTFLYATSNAFIQFSHFGFSYLLLNAFCREHEAKSYFWLKKHLFSEKDIVFSKVFFNIIFILSSVLLYIIVVLLLSRWFIFNNTSSATADLILSIKVIGILLASILYTTVLQLLFGYFASSFVKGVIVWIVYWFLIGIVNGVTPALGGYLSMLDSSSLQAGVLSFLTKGDAARFGQNHAIGNVTNYFYLSIIIPIVYTIGCLGVLWIMISKRGKSYFKNDTA